jgi:hypothetical protein
MRNLGPPGETNSLDKSPDNWEIKLDANPLPIYYAVIIQLSS